MCALLKKSLPSDKNAIFPFAKNRNLAGGERHFPKISHPRARSRKPPDLLDALIHFPAPDARVVELRSHALVLQALRVLALPLVLVEA